MNAPHPHVPRSLAANGSPRAGAEARVSPRARYRRTRAGVEISLLGVESFDTGTLAAIVRLYSHAITLGLEFRLTELSPALRQRAEQLGLGMLLATPRAAGREAAA